jgi:DNA-binding transcriptional LysR family regulator
VRLVDRSRTTAGLTDAGRALLPPRRCGAASAGPAAAATGRPCWACSIPSATNGCRPLRAELRERGEPWPELRPITLLDGFDPLAGLVDVGLYPLPLSGLEHLGIAVLAQRRPWVALPAAHPLAGGKEVRFADLHDLPAIPPPSHELWDRNVELLFRAQGLPLSVGQSAASTFEVLALVAEGRGWTFSASPSDFHPWPGVAFLPVAGAVRFRIGAVWDARRADTGRVAALVAALRAVAQRHETAPIDA